MENIIELDDDDDDDNEEVEEEDNNENNDNEYDNNDAEEEEDDGTTTTTEDETQRSDQNILELSPIPNISVGTLEMRQLTRAYVSMVQEYMNNLVHLSNELSHTTYVHDDWFRRVKSLTRAMEESSIQNVEQRIKVILQTHLNLVLGAKNVNALCDNVHTDTITAQTFQQYVQRHFNDTDMLAASDYSQQNNRVGYETSNNTVTASTLCSICNVNLKNVAMVPCGHTACDTCVSKCATQNCMFCRTPCSSMTIYL